MAVTLTTQALPYPGIHNIRCLGGYETQDGSVTKRDAIWRGCSLNGIEAPHREDLVARGLATIIDLRRDDEIAHAPNPLADDPRVVYVNIPLFDGLAPIDQMAEESAGSFDFGVRYIRALDECQDNMAAVLRTIAGAAPGGVYFHCTAGKDRTGMIAMLLLANAGVPRDIIAEEYGLTARLGASLMEQLREIIIERGQTPERTAQILASEPSTMHRVLDHLDDTYGGPVGYLDTIGIDAATRAQLAGRLV
ncbi:tyrosine-protein phosphatase [Pseudooceanicola sp. MF1-13]|uniref:tyrosine-protein phosphatase n=1 Tax=Pseudooceanicola sp. MF1-13 TaxID=3379095 RepID=UPI003891A291